MEIYRQSVRDYLRVCEALLASPELSDQELQAVQDMARRLAEEFLRPPRNQNTP